MRNRVAVVLIAMATMPFLATNVSAQAPAKAPAPLLLGAGGSYAEAGGPAGGVVINASKALFSGRTAGVGPVGDFSLHREDGVSWTSFGGGIRLTARQSSFPIIWFGEFLIGASLLEMSSSSSTHLTFNGGGGLHMPVYKRVNLLFQFNVLHVMEQQYAAKRTTVGISVRLGSN